MTIGSFLKERRGFIVACLMFMTFYMSHGCYYPFIGIYYDSIGLNMGQIGIISAVGPLLALLVQTLWGRLADRTDRRRVWMLTLALSGLVILLFLLNTSFIYVAFAAGLYVAVSTSSVPLMDTIALDYCQETGYRFSPIRMFGTIGFGIMPLLIGSLVAKDIKSIFGLYSVFCFVSIAVCAFLPRTGQPQPQRMAKQAQPGSKKILRSLLKDPVVIFVLLVNFMLATCMSTVTFLPVYASSMGMSTELVGTLNSVSAFAEVILFLFIDALLKKVKGEVLMVASVFFGALRMFLAFVGGYFPQNGYLFLAASQSLHAFSYIMMYYCSARVIHARVAPEVRATAQTLVAMVSMGLSRVVGSLLAGAIGDAVGLQTVFLVFAITSLAGSIPVLLFYRKAFAKGSALPPSTAGQG